MPSETTTTASPRRSSPPPSTSSKPLAPPRPPPLAPVGQQPDIHPLPSSNALPPDPVAPAFSPITPRAVPVLPAINLPLQHPPPPPQDGADTATMPPEHISAPQHQPSQPEQQPEPASKPAIAPTEFIPAPPSQPFSSEDSTDAIALRAAISSLQLQKKKAQDDIRTLEKVRKQALDEPERFKEELAAGRVQEKKMTAGDIRAILDAESDDDEEEEEEGKDIDMLTDAQDVKSNKQAFERIPGPQNVVRMPYINWDKYHVVGEPLDRMHEQQRKWPGNTAYGTDRGREHTVAAPYNPWLDPLEGGQAQERKDSGGGGSFSSASGMGTVSDHPMETRRAGVRK